MTTFIIITAAMIIVALAMLAPALLRKRDMAASDRDEQNVIIARERLQEMEVDLQADKISQEEFDQAKVELEQALLLDLKEEDGPDEVIAGPGRLTLGAIAVAIPVVTIVVYMMLGTPEMVEFEAAKQAPQSSSKQGAMPSVDEMLASLTRRLQENPDDAKGWFMLGRSYMALKRYPEAINAFETLLKLTGDEPTVMLTLAEAITMSQQGSMQGRPDELIRKALEMTPDNQTALWMGGLLESQQGNYTKALTLWRRLEPALKEDPGAQQKLQQLITELEKKQAEKPKAP